MEVIPEAPEDVRSLALRAYLPVRDTFEGSALSAEARERVRNIKSQRGIEGLRPDLRDLWDWHVENQAGFARLPFEEQKRDFLLIQAEAAVPELGIPAQVGRRGHDAFHAAGAPLLAWWEEQGQAVTANLGPDRNNMQPCETVRFLAAEFSRIAPDLGTVRAHQVGFKVASRHVQNHTAKR